MDEEIKQFLDKVIAVDTDSRWLYVGTLKGIGKGFLVLEDVDAHDLTETPSTRDEYLIAMKNNGLVVNRRRVVVNRERVVGLSLFQDVLVER
ncbi:MAG TPA: hypothetical protein EYP78_01540 [Candidatus Omnitrophica bacterium]|nr:hypothetical protein [Candidatus Omnitrophota bacterium]